MHHYKTPLKYLHPESPNHTLLAVLIVLTVTPCFLNGVLSDNSEPLNKTGRRTRASLLTHMPHLIETVRMCRVMGRGKRNREWMKFGLLEHLKNFTQIKTWLQLSSITASLLKTVADSPFYFTHPSCPPALWSASFLCCATCQWAVTGTVWACKDTHTHTHTQDKT